MMNLKPLIGISFLTLPLFFAGCLGTPTINSSTQLIKSSSPQVLATIEQLETYPTTNKGNQAQLLKSDQNLCQIQFTGFYETGKVVENWIFNNQTLVSGSTTKFTYAPSKSLDKQYVETATSTPFDIQDIKTIHNFEKLKHNFSKDVLKHCN